MNELDESPGGRAVVIYRVRRAAVYAAIEKERAYQDTQWGENADRQETTMDWIVVLKQGHA